jgi:hypothetical protein
MTEQKKTTSRETNGRQSEKGSGKRGAGWRVALAPAPLMLLVACGGPTHASSGITTTAARAQASSDADYGYSFEADPTKNAGASPASDLSLPHAAGDRIPPETVQAVLRSHYGAVVSCYQAGLSKNSSLAGTVTVKIVASAGGATQQAVDEGSTLPDKDVVACVVGEIAKASYPAGGGVLTVLYPIQLAP